MLKPTGSLYLHCDSTASHYLRVSLDAVFSPDNFRNEIIWKRANAHNDPKRYGRITDTILYYSKSGRPLWNQQHTPYREDYYATHFKRDEQGRWYRTVPLDAPKHGQGSPNLLYDWNGKRPAPTRTWAVRKEVMERYEQENRLRYTRTGTPTLLQYADEMPGVPLQNIWTDIPPVNPQARERLGFPTQKPLALLERIIASSSNEGDTVLDPFCGCGTAVVAAERLKRKWIGVDVTFIAIDLIRRRLEDAYGSTVSFQIDGIPKDMGGAQALFRANPFDFERWAVSLVYGQPNEKQVGDKGIDGVIRFLLTGKGATGRALISVKGGLRLQPAMVHEIQGTVSANKAEMGVLITLEKPTKGMVEAANHSGNYVWPLDNRAYPKVQIITIETLLNDGRIRMPPSLNPYIQATRQAAPKKQMTLGGNGG